MTFAYSARPIFNRSFLRKVQQIKLAQKLSDNVLSEARCFSSFRGRRQPCSLPAEGSPPPPRLPFANRVPTILSSVVTKDDNEESFGTIAARTKIANLPAHQRRQHEMCGQDAHQVLDKASKNYDTATKKFRSRRPGDVKSKI